MSGKSTGVLKVPKSFLNDRFIPLHTHTHASSGAFQLSSHQMGVRSRGREEKRDSNISRAHVASQVFHPSC